MIPKTWATFMIYQGGCPLHCWPLNNALLIMPVASIYRSTHLEIQLLSPPLRLELGFVIHFSKHFPLTVWKKKWQLECKCNGSKKNTPNIFITQSHDIDQVLSRVSHHTKIMEESDYFTLTKMLHLSDNLKKNL